MGWWSTTREGASFTSDDDGYVWGDGPADIVDDALDGIVKEFQETFNRDPRAGEIRAGLEFALMKISDETTYPVED